MNISNFISMLAGGFLLVMACIFLDKILYWPWFAQHLANDKMQTLTIAFFVGVVISGFVSMKNNQ